VELTAIIAVNSTMTFGFVRFSPVASGAFRSHLPV
jgi:hypothetical protein